MRIIIATGIYPPEPGGPATFCVGLENALRAQGHEVKVVLYGWLKKLPTGIRHVLYTKKLWWYSIGCDVIIALDTFSVGLPAAMVGRLLRKQVVIRAGGDFIWEQYLETGGEILLPDFYTSDHIFTGREKFIMGCTKYALAKSTVVFNTEWQKKIWMPVYLNGHSDVHVVANAIQAAQTALPPEGKKFEFHVRDIPMKNVARVKEAIARAQKIDSEILLDGGVVPHTQSMQDMRSCYAVLAPSLCDISPNYVMEALSFHKPCILTKYSGLTEWLTPYCTIVDPLNTDAITAAIVRLSTEEGYKEACAKAEKFSYVRTYDDISTEFLALVHSK